MRLEQILAVLAVLADPRTRSAADITAARVRARAEAVEDATARERPMERAEARREAREAEIGLAETEGGMGMAGTSSPNVTSAICDILVDLHIAIP